MSDNFSINRNRVFNYDTGSQIAFTNFITQKGKWE